MFSIGRGDVRLCEGRTSRRHAQPNTNPRNQSTDFPYFGAVVRYLRPGRVLRGRDGQRLRLGPAEEAVLVFTAPAPEVPGGATC